MFKKIFTTSLLAAMPIALPVASYASNFSYSQVNASLAYTQFDDDIVIDASTGSYELDSVGGLFIDGSWQFHDHFFVGLSTTTQSGESADVVVELTVGQGLMYLGGVYPINNQLDLVATAGVGNADVEICLHNVCFEDDVDITAVSVGARFKLTEVVELNASYNKINYDEADTDSDSSVSLGGAWWHSSTGSIYLNYSVGEDIGEDANTVNLGYRYSFER